MVLFNPSSSRTSRSQAWQVIHPGPRIRPEYPSDGRFAHQQHLVIADESAPAAGRGIAMSSAGFATSAPPRLMRCANFSSSMVGFSGNP
jgi:hypothetical protein